jgi:hypothetical protein
VPYLIFSLPNFGAIIGTSRNVLKRYRLRKVIKCLPLNLDLIDLETSKDEIRITPPICVRAVRKTKRKLYQISLTTD